MTDLETLAHRWSVALEEYRSTHYQCGDRLRFWNELFGSVGVVLSAVVAGGLLTTIHGGPGFWWKVGGAVVGLLATSLTGLRTFLQLGDAAVAHHTAATTFGSIGRRLEVFVDSHPDWGSQAAQDFMNKTAADISDAEQAAPGYSMRDWARGKRAVRPSKAADAAALTSI
jgi:hypothetical protein